LLGLGWLLHLQMMSRSAFDGFLGVLWPLFFATVAFFMFQAGADGETLADVSGLLGTEVLIRTVYAFAGYVFIRFAERLGNHATLERA
jgi:hypothetical protein